MVKTPAAKTVAVASISIPDVLVNGVGAELRLILKDGIEENNPSTGNLDLVLLDAVEQILCENIKSVHLVALLKEVGVTNTHKAVNGSIVNVLWLCGTQVRTIHP